MFSSEQHTVSQVGKRAEPDCTLLPQLLPHIPPMVASLLKEDSNSGSSCLDQLAELVHCMVFRFPGFPDLYEPVMEAIKVSDSPALLPHSTLTRASVGPCSGPCFRLVAAPIIWSVAVSLHHLQPILCFRHN